MVQHIPLQDTKQRYGWRNIFSASQPCSLIDMPIKGDAFDEQINALTCSRYCTRPFAQFACPRLPHANAR